MPVRSAPLLLVILLSMGCSAPGGRGVECVAPANAGGGWDLTCRSVGRALAELGLIPGSVRVTNMPGAGGGIAYAHAVTRRAGDARALFAASPATTLRLAQGQYADFDTDDVRWLAALAADFGIVAVRSDAPWADLPSLLEAWREDPTSIVVSGGSAVAGQDHMKMLVLGRQAGIPPRRIRYVPFDGGGEAMTALLGGFVEVFSGDASEIRGMLGDGDLRVLAVLGPERLELAPAVPTARELGYPVDWIVWRGFYLPPEVADSVYDRWLEAMDSVAGSEPWRQARAAAGLARFYRAGPDFEALVRDQVEEYTVLSRELGLIR